MTLFIAFVGIVNAIANHFFLYWRINEFDSFVHFTAGVSVSLAVLWFYFYSDFFRPEKRNIKNFVLISILGITFIGVMWEIFELGIGATSVADAEYYFDTTLDLIMDSLGALAGCFYACIKEYNREIIIKNNNEFN